MIAFDIPDFSIFRAPTGFVTVAVLHSTNDSTAVHRFTDLCIGSGDGLGRSVRFLNYDRDRAIAVFAVAGDKFLSIGTCQFLHRTVVVPDDDPLVAGLDTDTHTSAFTFTYRPIAIFGIADNGDFDLFVDHPGLSASLIAMAD